MAEERDKSCYGQYIKLGNSNCNQCNMQQNCMIEDRFNTERIQAMKENTQTTEKRENPKCFGEYGQPNSAYCTGCHALNLCKIQTSNLTYHAKVMKEAATSAYNRQFGRYFKDVSNLKAIDVYKVLELFDVKSHALGHAVKKILVAGSRGAKDEAQDIKEAIAALERHLEILGEK